MVTMAAHLEAQARSWLSKLREAMMGSPMALGPAGATCQGHITK